MPPFAAAADAGDQAAINDRIHIVRINFKTYDTARTNARNRRKLVKTVLDNIINDVLAALPTAGDPVDPAFW